MPHPFRTRHSFGVLAFITGFTSLLALTARAGDGVAGGNEGATPVERVRELLPNDPRDTLTVGGDFSAHLSGLFIDTTTGLWAPQKRDALFFFDSRYHLEDNGESITSNGLAYRKLLPEREVILGANAYWDAISSAQGKDFNQLGLGAEVLTHWVDVRFCYDLPENDQVVVSQRTEQEFHRSLGPGVLRTTTRTRMFETREAALEGCNAEVGVLLPLCKYTEVRLYGGYYHYDNPFGRDYDGFKARLEARLLPGLTAGVEYWNNAALMGGHWTGEVRATVPFSLYNLVTLRNPFEGIGEYFTPRPREFKERLGDVIERSPRIQTATSGDIPTGEFSRIDTAFFDRP